jgi:hypothetical protein
MKLEMRTKEQPKDAKVFVQLMDLEPNPPIVCPDSCFVMEVVGLKFHFMFNIEISCH